MRKIVLLVASLIALSGCQPPIPNSAAHAKAKPQIWGIPLPSTMTTQPTVTSGDGAGTL